MDKIKCRLCDKEYGVKQFGMHISRTHKMSYQEYAQQHWEDLPNWSPCTECGTVCKDTYCSKECYSYGQSKKFKGIKQTPRTKEHCDNISKSAKKRLKDKANHPMYGKSHSSKTKDKISKSQKIRIEENGHWAEGTSLSDETKIKISETRIKRKVAKGKNNPMYGKTHTPEAIKKIFTHKPMNKLEKQVADYLDEHNIEYTFQFFINEGDVCKSYDFKLKNTNTIIEVHGDYWHGGSGVKKHHNDVGDTIENDKLKKELAESKGYDVLVFWEHDLKKDISILNTIL